jgi:hypothetical protein
MFSIRQVNRGLFDEGDQFVPPGMREVPPCIVERVDDHGEELSTSIQLFMVRLGASCASRRMIFPLESQPTTVVVPL